MVYEFKSICYHRAYIFKIVYMTTHDDLLSQRLFQDRIDEAVRFHNDGNLIMTKRVLEELLAIAPNSADALHLLSLVEVKNQNPNIALKNISKAIELSPLNAAMHNSLGIVLHELCEYDQAIASYGEAIRINPGFSEAFYNAGNAYCQKNDLNQALTCYESAITLNSSYINAHLNMGIVGFDLGLYLKAVESFERVLILDPTHAEAYFNKGLALEELGRLNEALIDYDRALIFKSNHIGALARKTNLKHSLSK